MMAAARSAFTPSLMPPAELEALLVQRGALADRLLDLARESATTGSKHYSLLVGPRGIGKTHLLALLYHRICADAQLRQQVRIAWLREEEWGVSSFLGLLMRIFRALRDSEDIPGLDQVEALRDLSPETAEHRAGTLLRELMEGRTLVLLMENLDDLFLGLKTPGQQKLRAYIQENPFFAITATSPTLFNGVTLRNSPFFGFFRIEPLLDFSLEDAIELLRRVADMEGDQELVDFLGSPAGRARVRAVQYLAGGNPRVYIILSQFLTRTSLDELVGPFMKMMDDLTPYYSSRMLLLSRQQQEVVEYLCDRQGAVPVKEIARHFFASHQTISSQLKDLREKRYVRAHGVGREEWYELCEPLMRLCIDVKRSRGGPIRLFVEFLRLWYSRDEIARLGLDLPETSLARMHTDQALQLIEQRPSNPVVDECLARFKETWDGRDYTQSLDVAAELIAVSGAGNDWIRKGQCLIELGRYPEAIAACEEGLTHGANPVGALAHKALALRKLGRFEEQMSALDTALESSQDALRRLDLETKADRTSERVPRDMVEKLARVRSNCLKSAREMHMNLLLERGFALLALGEAGEATLSLGEAFRYVDHGLVRRGSPVIVCLARGRWEQAMSRLQRILSNYRPEEEDEVAVFSLLVVTSLYRAPYLPVADTLRSLIQIYRDSGIVTLLAAMFLVSTLSTVQSVTDMNTMHSWLDRWTQAAGDDRSLDIVLRVARAAVRYLDSGDFRELLRLSTEERGILAELPGFERFQTSDDV